MIFLTLTPPIALINFQYYPNPYLTPLITSNDDKTFAKTLFQGLWQSSGKLVKYDKTISLGNIITSETGHGMSKRQP